MYTALPDTIACEIQIYSIIKNKIKLMWVPVRTIST